jgi:hypothetical protein
LPAGQSIPPPYQDLAGDGVIVSGKDLPNQQPDAMDKAPGTKKRHDKVLIKPEWDG